MNAMAKPSYMQQRVNNVCAKPEREWFLEHPILEHCHDYHPETYAALVAKHQRERTPCVIRGCFEVPENTDAHQGLTERLERERVLGRDHLDPMFWIDDEDRVTPLHYDNFDNQMFIASGTKIFVFYSPRQHKSLYHPWSRLGRGRQSPLDIENPDFTKFPRYKDATPEIAVVKAGDMLYIPADWSHQVYTIDCKQNRGIGINYWYPVTLKELWRVPSEKLSFVLWTSVANLVVRAKRKLTGKRMAVPQPVEVIYTLTQEDRQAADIYAKNLDSYLNVLSPENSDSPTQ
ncbi:MAG: hypothetical protein EP343_08945 [Deltaproteobacteria bacterium]|nr:MAG: hypothetical protein EP343_08945 [Deltaproteobacteria bacterium]